MSFPGSWEKICFSFLYSAESSQASTVTANYRDKANGDCRSPSGGIASQEKPVWGKQFP